MAIMRQFHPIFIFVRVSVMLSLINKRAVVRALHQFSSTTVNRRFAMRPLTPFLYHKTSPIMRFMSTSDTTSSSNINATFYADLPDFESMGLKSSFLLERLQSLGLKQPTSVQAAAFEPIVAGEEDILLGAETGSGKSYAYLLPIFDDLLQQGSKREFYFARALILVPNKELVQQVLRMSLALTGGGRNALVYGISSLPDEFVQQLPKDDKKEDHDEMIRFAIFPGGLKSINDFPPFRNSSSKGRSAVDILISTPAAIGPLGLSPKNVEMFADIQTVVIDEADMLLDGGYLRALQNTLMAFRRADRVSGMKTQHVFVAATLPDSGLSSVDAFLRRRFPKAQRLFMAGMHNARHGGLREQTTWILEESKKLRMEKLIELLKLPADQGGLQNEKVMVFLNTLEDVEGAAQALLSLGMKAMPYHAKIPLGERTRTLDGFRRYSRDHQDMDDTFPILVCSDLASRGLDIPGVNAVVSLQFAGNVVAHLHRMGRCGRAGHRTGRGIVFYGAQEAELVAVVQDAEQQQIRMELQGDVDDDDIDDDDDMGEGEEAAEVDVAGTIKKAFSRKRGFTKKIKKLKKESSSSSTN